MRQGYSLVHTMCGGDEVVSRDDGGPTDKFSVSLQSCQPGKFAWNERAPAYHSSTANSATC